MPTTRSGFLKFTSGGAAHLVAVAAAAIDSVKNALGATRLDLVTTNFATTNFTKSGVVRLTLSGTTPQDVSLADTTLTGAYAGDTAFASFSQLVLYNDGAASVTVTPGGSNPASLPLSGTGPGITVAAGAQHVFTFATPVTVDSTHKILTVTPTSGGSFVLLIGGA